MEDGRILAISLGVSTLGLIMLFLLSATQGPVPISSITPEDMGSRVFVKGHVEDYESSGEGHMFFYLKDNGSRIRVAIFKEVAGEINCGAEGEEMELWGVVDEYRGELEIIPSKSVDVRC